MIYIIYMFIARQPWEVKLTVKPEDQTTLRNQTKTTRKKGKGKGRGKVKATPVKSTKGKKGNDDIGEPPKKRKKKSEGTPKSNKDEVEVGDESEKRGKKIKKDPPKNSDGDAENGDKVYGCSRCRYAAKGCRTCKDPNFKPRGPRAPKKPVDVD